MNITSYNRYQAFAVHFAASFVIFLILLVMIFNVWYPGVFFDSEQGWKAILLIVGVDLVLGPLLTLIVFNPAKKSLKFDLAVIAILQLSALLAGSFVINERRPVAFVSFDLHKGFMTLYATNFDDKTLQYVKKQGQKLFLYHPDSENQPDLKQPISAPKIKSTDLVPFSPDNLKAFSEQNPSFPTDKHNLAFNLDKGVKDSTYLLISADARISGVRRGNL